MIYPAQVEQIAARYLQSGITFDRQQSKSLITKDLEALGGTVVVGTTIIVNDNTLKLTVVIIEDKEMKVYTYSCNTKKD